MSLQSTGVTYGTRHTYMCALIMFYEINDIIIRKKKISRFLGEESTRKNKDRAYTIEEIRKLLDHASIRDKALVLLLASTGMRIGAIENLMLKHLAKKVPSNRSSNHPHLYRITVYENTREEYNTYCTPECAAAIGAYLDYRKRNGGERLTPESPLFRENFDKMAAIVAGFTIIIVMIIIVIVIMLEREYHLR